MAIGWFICPYRRGPLSEGVTRYCAMDDYTTHIAADGGAWSEAECLGNHAVVKVRASASTLTTIAGDGDIVRLPVAALATKLSALTGVQRNVLLNKILALGYPQQEIDQILGSGVTLGNRTLEDALRFVLRRRLKPRYDVVSGQVVLDGPSQWVKPLALVDAEVQ